MKARYSESLLQWVWENLEFDLSNLRTSGGSSVQILEPGRRNSGAGPDFLNACVIIDGLEFHGAVEIHNREKEWLEHGHQEDPEFNKVILHVVLDGSGGAATTSDGYRPPLLKLSSLLDKPLYKLLKEKEIETLPCADNITQINQRAFEVQVERAHREYFNYKVDELMSGYDPGLIPSEAWMKTFLLQLYSALGIPSNRNSMKRLLMDLSEIISAKAGKEEFINEVMELAFSKPTVDKYNWSFSGMRPGSQPKNRVRQAAALHYQIIDTGFSTFLKSGVNSWGMLTGALSDSELPGSSRMEIIHKTVFLPSIYLIGDLFHARHLCSKAYNIWEKSVTNLPKEVRQPFEKSGFELGKGLNKMGLAHQYKRFCKERNCHKCEVFKSVINS